MGKRQPQKNIVRKRVQDVFNVLLTLCMSIMLVPAAALATDTASDTALAITTTDLPEATADVAYSATLEVDAVDGDGTITWSLQEGSSLPEGLTLGTDGTITGTPTASGSATFTVVAADGTAVATQELTLIVASAGGPMTLSSGFDGFSE